MQIKFDKDAIKLAITDDQMFQFLKDAGGEPEWRGETIVSRTICHNRPECPCSHKLYYYTNTKLFKCYTGCVETGGYDIFDLIKKINKLQNIELSLYDAQVYAINYFSLDIEGDFSSHDSSIEDFVILSKYGEKMQTPGQQKRVVLNEFDEKILKNLPFKIISNWEKEGITAEVMQHKNIKFDPYMYGVVIPHYDKDSRLVGIRERTLIKDNESDGKYRPAILNGKMYNHPLGFNLYNLNNSKKNINLSKRAIVFEGEKGCLTYASMFGEDNDITVACCGSSFTAYQCELLLNEGAEEIIFAFDKQFKEQGDAEWKRWTKKLASFSAKYSAYANITFMFDRSGKTLGYKDSPIDKGKDAFVDLFRNRFSLNYKDIK